MKKEKITSFQHYLETIERIHSLKNDINLYRGQSTNAPLLPSIAREHPSFDTTEIEKEMITDLKRRSFLLIDKQPQNDWEWLIFAQHFGLKTRLLDWSSNPLIALWFACSNEYQMGSNSYVYVNSAPNDMLVNLEKDQDPFQNSRTKILRPSLNNERIVAQSGWFTAHRFSKSNNRFVTLETHRKMKNQISELEIPHELKKDFLQKLSVFGVNNTSVFPDVTGLCLHLNWEYKNKTADIMNKRNPSFI